MRRALRAIRLALLLAAAGGCKNMVDQGQEVATWRALVDSDAPAQLAPLQSGEALTLGRALALANHVDENLASQGEAYLQALIDRRRQAALLYPAISLAPTAFVREHVSGNSIPGSQDHRTDVPVQAVYSNFEPWSQVASLERSASTIEAQRALLLEAKSALLLQVAQSYYSVLRAEKQAQVLESSLSVQEERLADVEAQNQVGFARMLDVAQARAQAAGTRVLLVTARSAAVDSRAALAFYIGAEKVDGPLDDKLEVPAQVEDNETLRTRALDARQNLVAARAESAAALQGVDVAVGQYYPGVSLNLSYFLYRETVPDESLWAALVAVNLPIFSFGRIQADVRTAWSVFRQSKDVEARTARAIGTDVEIALADLHASEDLLAALQPQVDAAQEAFQQTVDLLRAGKATNLERIVVQSQLLVAQLAIADAQYAHKLAWLALLRTCGTLDLHLE
jgi:outer membrane protein